MKQSKLILGSFVSFKEPDYLLGIIKEAKKYQSVTMMFFLGSPQKYNLFPEDKLQIKEFHQLLKKSDLSLKNVFVHLPYLINLGNLSDRVLKTSFLLLRHNLKLCQKLGIQKVILHPGASLQNDRNDSLLHLSMKLKQILKEFPSIIICLETMSGRGTEIGKNFEELKIILDAVDNDRLQICFDICHLYSAGYDLKNKLHQVIDEFDQKIGLNKLAVIHVNDSKTGLASKVDRHENIGQGKIGFDAIYRMLHYNKLNKIPMILETPYLKGNPLYQEEIEKLQN